MPPVGFEPTISVLERAKAVHVLDRSATVIGITLIIPFNDTNTVTSKIVLFYCFYYTYQNFLSIWRIRYSGWSERNSDD
jgi:hypothetical protein